VCINYTGISFGNEAELTLNHYESGAWVDQTISLDTVNNVICASVSSFSSFAIFEPEAPTATYTPTNTPTDTPTPTLTPAATATAACFVPGFTWARQLSGAISDIGNSIAVDGSGNVYTTGYFAGTSDFDPSAGTSNLTSVGSADVFISKLDSSGDFVWARRLGGTIYDEGKSITVDGSGNVYTTGLFSGTADFDPGASTFNLISTGDADIFISKLDPSGNFVWARRLGGTTFDEGKSITVDGSGNLYTTGSFSGTADFDPGTGTSNLTSVGSGDVFVSKLDSSGNFVWAVRWGGTSADQGRSIVLDGPGNVYTTGSFFGSADFDPGAGTSNLTSAGLTDVFISKLDSSGNYVWAGRLGGTGSDNGNNISVDGSGDVYTTGSFGGTADFDPGAGTSNLTSAGNGDVFVSKLDGSGSFVWAVQLGGTGSDAAFGAFVDGSGNVYTTGVFQGTVDFDPAQAPSISPAQAVMMSSSPNWMAAGVSSGQCSWAGQVMTRLLASQ
jgi:hypothetical protein